MLHVSSRGIVTAVLFVVIIGFIVYAGAKHLPWRTPADPAVEWFNETRGEFRALQMRSLTDAGAVLGALGGMTIEHGGVVDQTLSDELLAMLLEAIESYFGEANPDRYKAFRRAAGAKFRSFDDLAKNGINPKQSLQALHEHLGVSAFPAESVATPEAAFDALWIAMRKIDGGGNIARAICTGSSGLLTRITTVSAQAPYPPPLRSGMSERAWYGGVTMSSSRFMAMSTSYLDMVRSHGTVTAAVTGIVFEFGDGTRRPIVFHSYFDRDRQKWILHEVMMTNFPVDRWIWPWML